MHDGEIVGDFVGDMDGAIDGLIVGDFVEDVDGAIDEFNDGGCVSFAIFKYQHYGTSLHS